MTIALLVKCSIGLALVATLAPTILFCFFPQVIRAWFEGGPDAVEPAGSQKTRMLVAQLKDLGFRALGVKVEKAPLRARIREVSLVAADRGCYASVAARRGSPIYYYTPFPDGGLVLSSNGAFPRIETARVVQRSYRGCGAQDLLEHHRKTLSSSGRQGDVVASADARVEATYGYYRTPEVRRLLRRMGVLLVAFAVLLGWLVVRW